MNNKMKIIVFIAIVAAAFFALEQHQKHQAESAPSTELLEQAIQQKTEPQEPIVIPPRPSRAGSSLSARFAIGADDLATANKYFQQSVELSANEQEKAFFYERALPAALGAGDIKSA